MPVGSGQLRDSSRSSKRRPQQYSVQLSLPAQPSSAPADHHRGHHSSYQQHQQQHRDDVGGSKTPSSSQHHYHQHQHQAALPRQQQLSLATLMLLKRKLRDVRTRLQQQQQQQQHATVSRSGGSENSYRTQPLTSAFPSPSVARQVLENSLIFFLGDLERYCPRACGKLLRILVEDAKRRLKASVSSHRFKLVVTATVMQKARQGAAAASRCLMDTSCDSFVTACLERPTFLASATAYWFYYE